jgi:hypothetical protein
MEQATALRISALKRGHFDDVKALIKSKNMFELYCDI